MIKTRWLQTGFAAVAAVVTVLAGVNAATSAGEASARSNLTAIVPAATGGGWDGFTREAQQVLRSDGIVNNVQVVNIPGAGGTIGLSQFVQQEGSDDTLMTSGGVMVGAIALNDSEYDLGDVTPIARMADDFSALVVPADSDIQTLDDFIAQWKKDPHGLSISGGSLGSIDHLLSGMLAKEVGIDPTQVNYIAYSGGGEALNSLLSHSTTVGVSGYNEVADQIDAGTLRAIAISSEERVPGVDVPTFKELGTDVSMANWRGFVAAPGISSETKSEYLEIIDELHSSKAWKQTLKRNNWTDSYMVGDELDRFIADETETAERTVDELGL